MNRNVSFIRKVVYVAIIALLLFPLFYLGQPATRESKGGLLAEMRTTHGLTQSGLGEIDPASETMKLSTLGLRPVAVALLWNDANRYKMKEDWDHFSATVKQIVRLQPNFIKIWDYQAHNISYNVSVEFDNYKHRYHWVKKGFDFLTEGTHYNKDNPLLLQRLGWFFGQKIGRSDEQKQFRRLFRADTDFHDKLRVDLTEMDKGEADGPDGRPDNWLVGRLWNIHAQDAVDHKGKPLIGNGPLIFYSYAPMMRINFAKAIEEEGFLEEQAEIIWMKAGDEWRRYGERDIASSWGHNVRIGTLDRLTEELKELTKKFDEFAPAARPKLRAELRSKMSTQMLAAYDKLPILRTPDEEQIAADAEKLLQVPHEKVLEQVPAADRDRAKRVLAQLREMEAVKAHTESYGRIVNYEYWKTRCEVEQKKETVTARRHQFKGTQLLREAKLEDARVEFEKAWDLWLGVLTKYPQLIEDVSGDELYESIQKYEAVLGQLDKPLPDDFKLRALRDYFVDRRKGLSPPLPKIFRADAGPEKPIIDVLKIPERTSTPTPSLEPSEDKKDVKDVEKKSGETKKEEDKKIEDKKADAPAATAKDATPEKKEEPKQESDAKDAPKKEDSSTEAPKKNDTPKPSDPKPESPGDQPKPEVKKAEEKPVTEKPVTEKAGDAADDKNSKSP